MQKLPVSKNGLCALDVAVNAAKAAGEILRQNFTCVKDASRKSHGNFVTGIDRESEKLVLDILASEYPGQSVLSEETRQDTVVSGYTWIVDPLDGTNNYVFGIPFFCANVALSHNGSVVLGVSYDPTRDELFTAVKDEGAFLNGQRIHVTGEANLRHTDVGFDIGYNHERGTEILYIASQLWGNVHCLRALGSSALGLAYVAAGRIGLYFHRCLFPWDIASGMLLVAEAGGRVVEWNGDPAKYSSSALIASNELLVRRFFEIASL